MSILFILLLSFAYISLELHFPCPLYWFINLGVL
jgi:hypothetical protein